MAAQRENCNLTSPNPINNNSIGIMSLLAILKRKVHLEEMRGKLGKKGNQVLSHESYSLVSS